MIALQKISKPGMRFDLSAMRELSRRLGDPWRSFPSILIAGTNGKGSTAAVLSEILAQSGRSVGLYTSPHLSSYRERLQIIRVRPYLGFVKPDAGSERWVSEAAWKPAFDKLSDSFDEIENRFTEFEILTAMAFLVFQEAKVDIAVLEAGLGGRLDATNIADPILSVITTIDYDHKEILGNTLSQIAYEKAGILRPGKPAIALEQEPEAQNSLIHESNSKKSELSFVKPGRLLSMSIDGQQFEYDGALYRQKMLGKHQVANASLAIEAAKRLNVLGYSISGANIKDGVRLADWPARMEILSESPLTICDGAHNPQGCRLLALSLNALRLPRPHILILGILEEKDVAGMVRALASWGDRWIVTRSDSPRAVPCSALAEIIRKEIPEKPLMISPKVAEAYQTALNETGGNGIICFAGSLTVAAAARQILKL